MNVKRNVGRIVFCKNERKENEWKIITLESHINNVVCLAKSWDPSKAYFNTGRLPLDKTKDKLIIAAEIHDSAKPSKFSIEYNNDYWAYSFKGHRFEVFHEDPYVQALARMHHEYSIEGITRAVAELKSNHIEYADNFPLDLYALEMCDQIEASLATAVFGGNIEERVFMDFYLCSIDSCNYEIDPYPFLKNIKLTVEFISYNPTPLLLEKKDKDLLKREIIEIIKTIEPGEKVLTLCPLN